MKTVYMRFMAVLYKSARDVPVWLPAALSRLREHMTVYFFGVRDAKLPEELAARYIHDDMQSLN